jgi:hypothetical protein
MMFVYEIHATFANILTSKHVAGHRFLAQAPKKCSRTRELCREHSEGKNSLSPVRRTEISYVSISNVIGGKVGGQIIVVGR